MAGSSISTRARRGNTASLAGRTYVGTETHYIDDACPSIMGVVFAETRRRLWQITQVAGESNVAYMDTDSIFTNAQGSRRLRAWIKSGQGWGLRPKGRHRDLTLLGPRQLVVDGFGRIAGVPKRARQTDANVWRGHKWDGCKPRSGAPRPRW